MTSIVNIQTQIDAIAAPIQAQPADVSQHDAQRFQQALINHIQPDASPSDLIRNGIAAIENQDRQFRAALSQLASGGPSSISTASAQALVLEQQKMRVAYEAEARVISIMTQNTNELTHMQ